LGILKQGVAIQLLEDLFPVKFNSNANLTHLNELITAFRITRKFQANLLGHVGGNFCRTLALQEKNWTPCSREPQYDKTEVLTLE